MNHDHPYMPNQYTMVSSSYININVNQWFHRCFKSKRTGPKPCALHCVEHLPQLFILFSKLSHETFLRILIRNRHIPWTSGFLAPLLGWAPSGRTSRIPYQIRVLSIHQSMTGWVRHHSCHQKVRAHPSGLIFFARSAYRKVDNVSS